MEKYNIKKLKSQLNKVAKQTDTKADAAIFIILNQMTLYNTLVDSFLQGDESKAYFLFQISANIFKQLAAFRQIPLKQKIVDTVKEDSKLDEIKRKVNEK